MTENKSQDKNLKKLKSWLLNRALSLAAKNAPKQQIEELFTLAKKIIPDKEDLDNFLGQLLQAANGQKVPEEAVQEEPTPKKETLLERLNRLMPGWKINMTFDPPATIPASFLSNTLIATGVGVWVVRASLDREKLTPGTLSLTMDLESRHPSAEAAVNQILERYEELKAIGLAF